MIRVGPDGELPVDGDDGLLSFQQAVREQLALLRREVGLDLWMLTRVVGKDWIVVQASGGLTQIERGTVFAWKDTLCERMVRGQGPAYCASAAEVPAYAYAPLRELLDIEAYLGVALQRHDGSLFGTLCGIDSGRGTVDLDAHAELLDFVARTLATMIEREALIAHESRLAEHEIAQAGVDPATGTLNPTAWRKLLAAEDALRQPLLSPAGILAMSSTGRDDAGAPESREVRMLRALRRTVGPGRMLAQLGSGRLAALIPECDGAHAAALRKRGRAYLTELKLAPCCSAVSVAFNRSLAEAERDALKRLQAPSA